MSLKKLFLLSFALFSLGDLAAVMAGSGAERLLKPGILVSLICYYIVAAEGKLIRKFLIALILCLAGDILLIFARQDQQYFLLGLMAFLSAHVMYLQVFRALINPERTAGTRYELLPFIVLLIISGIIVVVHLYKDLNEMLMPVIIYTIVIILMAINALMRKGKTSPLSFYLVLTGALLFMTSDIALAMNKFRGEFAHSGLLIMGTYCSAQLLIVLGVLRHD